MTKLILSLDGGGIRGAATTQFLTRLEEKLVREHSASSIRDYVDFYAGTSTGSIIALALATTDMSMSDINALYSYPNAKKIFSENKGFFEFDGVNAPKYDGEGKTKLLKEKMGDAKLSDVPIDKHVLAVAYGVESRKPVVFKSTHDGHCKIPSYRVADASSAAPTYFPTKEMESPTGCEDLWLVDGGVTANNPTMCAIAEARKAWSEIPIDKLRVLSIGTGYRTRKINGRASSKWGALQWFTKGEILDVLTDERVVAYQVLTITNPGSCIRVNAEMTVQPGMTDVPDDAMDDISKENIRRLKKMGDFWFERYGEAAAALLLNSYEGPSLDRIDPKTGEPIEK
ncbi:patatin-like phospholipase family protein [Teredinibacter haidensis]|uniref:patatin-like phospholipase family protein n=1 Tax=Teredinibacter haidensis TaxID=2731755 RepID=UPI000948F1E5|nr:patatin-like phospholipase family protein [Teredinibacter haidensis]